MSHELDDIISKNLTVHGQNNDNEESCVTTYELDMNNQHLQSELLFTSNVFRNLGTQLISLHLDHNCLTFIPSGIFPLMYLLQNLSLHQNQLQYLPDDFCELKSLQECRLDDNQLHSLPNNIGQLQSLVLLHLSGNITLSELPYSIGQLKQLHHILMDRVNITSLPSSMCECDSLEFIVFDEDLLIYPPLEIMHSGMNAMRNYLRMNNICPPNSI
jgi:Leucine-rich repeat (LRR) protein